MKLPTLHAQSGRAPTKVLQGSPSSPRGPRAALVPQIEFSEDSKVGQLKDWEALNGRHRAEAEQMCNALELDICWGQGKFEKGFACCPGGCLTDAKGIPSCAVMYKPAKG